MFRTSWGRILAGALLVLGAIGIAILAYEAGLSAGVASAASGTSAGPALGPWAYAGHWAGFPWFLFWPIVPILFFVLVFLLVRAVFWGGRAGHGGPWDSGRWGGPGGRLDEWHRQAHREGRGADDTSPRGGPTEH